MSSNKNSSNKTHSEADNQSTSNLLKLFMPNEISYEIPLDETESKVIHWLAQAHKRNAYPIDKSDLQGLSAFEYTWKSFNALYASFSGKPDSVKMEKCIHNYLVERNEYLLEARELAENIANSAMKHERWDEDEKKAVALILSLSESLQKGDQSLIPINIIKFSYLFRNRRIHGKIKTITASEYTNLPSLLSKSLALLCVYLVSGKSKLKVDDINKLILVEQNELLEESILLVSTWEEKAYEQLLACLIDRKRQEEIRRSEEEKEKIEEEKKKIELHKTAMRIFQEINPIRCPECKKLNARPTKKCGNCGTSLIDLE